MRYKVGDKIKKIKRTGHGSDIIPVNSIGVITNVWQTRYSIKYNCNSHTASGEDSWIELLNETADDFNKYCLNI